ncbi:sigma-70 family RNA polymerase sigma factor [uncultured Ilyobacter sp.]|uniref:sigma-70 family RNA polymerase sigma factor n=1 Tax=uncultured Ilyobacter sp. TaxID=544433 RepID=UPI0029F55E74|nr:sigma-70 family RNA polymerase sigma factor [uncultured Ilyobacter sp.]
MSLNIDKLEKKIKEKVLLQEDFEEFVCQECSEERDFQALIDFIFKKGIEIQENEENYEDNVGDGYYSEEILEQYFHDISLYTPIPREEEKDIVIKAQAGEEEARETLVTSNLKLVAKIAMKYSKSGVNYIDLIQDGTIGLITAIDKYDLSKGHSFTSYSVWWIKREIINSIANRINTIKIPSYVYLMNKKIRIFEDEFMEKNNKKPSYQEISEGLNLSQEEVKKMKEASEIGVGGFANGNEPDLGDFNTVDQIDKELDLLEERSKISNLMRKISPEEQKVVEMYYGLDDNKRVGFKEISKKMGLSVEKVKFLKERAILKLKCANERMWG